LSAFQSVGARTSLRHSMLKRRSSCKTHGALSLFPPSSSRDRGGFHPGYCQFADLKASIDFFLSFFPPPLKGNHPPSPPIIRLGVSWPFFSSRFAGMPSAFPLVQKRFTFLGPSLSGLEEAVFFSSVWWSGSCRGSFRCPVHSPSSAIMRFSPHPFPLLFPFAPER